MVNSYRKGYRGENQLVHIFKESGIEAKRVPMSGGTQFAKGDIHISHNGGILRAEVKIRKNAFNLLYALIDVNKHNMMLVRQDNELTLILMRLTDFIEFLCGGITLQELQEIEPMNFKRGLKKVYEYLEGNDILIVKADRREYLVLTPYNHWVNLL